MDQGWHQGAQIEDGAIAGTCAVACLSVGCQGVSQVVASQHYWQLVLLVDGSQCEELWLAYDQ